MVSCTNHHIFCIQGNLPTYARYDEITCTVCLVLSVRMAERSKAPDSRFSPCLQCRSMGVLVHECGRGFKSHF